ncbi:hypothetical protein ACLOJK_022862 [Asimina triloba]
MFAHILDAAARSDGQCCHRRLLQMPWWLFQDGLIMPIESIMMGLPLPSAEMLHGVCWIPGHLSMMPDLAAMPTGRRGRRGRAADFDSRCWMMPLGRLMLPELGFEVNFRELPDLVELMSKVSCQIFRFKTHCPWWSSIVVVSLTMKKRDLHDLEKKVAVGDREDAEFRRRRCHRSKPTARFEKGSSDLWKPTAAGRLRLYPRAIEPDPYSPLCYHSFGRNGLADRSSSIDGSLAAMAD